MIDGFILSSYIMYHYL